MNPQELRSQAYVTSLRQRARTLSTQITLAHPPEAVWPFVSNTDMVNAQMHLPTVQVRSRPTGKGGSELSVESQELGLPIRYEELPYEWQSPTWLSVERIFSHGPVSYLRFEARLEALADGRSEATLSIAVVPKLPWFFIRPRIQQLLERKRKVYANIDRRVSRQQSALGIEAFLGDPALCQSEIDKLSKDWEPLAAAPAMARAIATYIYTAPDRYVNKLRPFELAELYGLEPMDTLCFFLKATKAGFLNLSWDLICPGCQGAKAEASSLASVNPHAHCEICDIDYSIRFDENFELTFHPVATVRRFFDAPFCAGSPSNTAHLTLQKNLWPGQTEILQLQLAPGLYKFRSPTIPGALHFEAAADGLKQLDLNLNEHFALEEPMRLAPGCMVTAHNRRDILQTLSVENLGWRAKRVTAALVSTLQDFRDSFSSEVLRPGISLAVSNLTVMFTDLKDSTLMYEVQGDAYAFNLVQEHFEIMQELIREAHGAVVKTIGDAIMAVFQEPAEALSCALMIQHEFRQWNREWHKDDPDRRIIVKVGLHRGPSIALTLNERLDYFGTTINRAARIQSESVGEDIVLSSEMLQVDKVRELLRDYKLNVFEKNLKGLSGKHRLYRVRFNDQAAFDADQTETSEVLEALAQPEARQLADAEVPDLMAG